MDTTIVSLIASLLTGTIAGITAKSLVSAISMRGKKIISISSEGKEETITAPAGASDSDIRHRVLESIELEEAIAEALTRLRMSDSALTFHSSKAVDFVASVSGRKLAIEAKLDPRAIRPASIRSYLSAEPGIERVFIVSPLDVTSRTRELIAKDPEGKRVHFVQIKPDKESVQDQLGAELKAVLSGPAA